MLPENWLKSGCTLKYSFILDQGWSIRKDGPFLNFERFQALVGFLKGFIMTAEKGEQKSEHRHRTHRKPK